ncbi:calcium-binding protein [Kumtagia ephedrae]|uniref:calcium-binding protein n=1 Tax=Kumtagia ephedrae TaxID=2116701 RepID=UPI000EA9C137|nr:calcium-binding protein [Mesorhizobium ephedrae]
MAKFEGDDNPNVLPGLLGIVTGLGDDEIYGKGGDDTCIGYAGNDIIEGGAGADNIIGGVLNVVLNVGTISLSGNDTAIYDTSTAGVTINLSTTSTIDVNVLGVKIALTNATVGSGGHAEGDILTGITNLRGSNFKDTLIGNADANVLTGLDGDDTLTGALGNDTLVGGNGADTLNGGLGNDKMTGGLGNDTYIVNSLSDVVDEVAGGGTADRVASNIDWVLAAGQEIEVLTTTKSTGTSSIDLRGNALAQRIVGNDGNNRLHDGGTGPGASDSQPDTLIGRDGNDTYIVYNSNAVVVERAAEGTDRVAAGVDYQLGNGVHVESLVTTSQTATDAIDLTGNKFAQTIIGNDGDNVLNDGGAGAADVMRGRDGDDTYFVYNSGDTIIEAGGEGQDTVATFVDFVLAAGVEVEVMKTTNSKGFAGVDLTGNEFAQEIFGNAGANRLDGKGGSDTLTGSAGPDTYVFSSALGAGNVDTIVGYNVASDTIELASAIFTVLGAGPLAAEAFVANAAGAATAAAHRIIYDTDSGALLYDADGNAGGSSAVQFASLAPGLSLTSADFVVA